MPNQNGRLKKTEIFNSPKSQFFFEKILGIGPWVTSKVINLGSDTFGNPIFQKGLQN